MAYSFSMVQNRPSNTCDSLYIIDLATESSYVSRYTMGKLHLQVDGDRALYDQWKRV